MATVMESAFNLAGWFVARRPGLILAAQREMAAVLLRRKLDEVKAQIVGGGAPRTAEDLELAVRHLGARVSLRRGLVRLPGMPGWALAGRRERRVA